MNILRIIVLLLAVTALGSDSFASLTLLHAGKSSSGGGGSCSNKLDLSQACNSGYTAIGGMF